MQKLNKTVSLQPFHSDAYYHMASISYLSKDFKNSIKYANKSLAINPKRIECYIELAESMLQLKNEKECLETYPHTLNEHEQNAKINY